MKKKEDFASKVSETNLKTGRVVRAHGSFYYVDFGEGDPLPCVLRGKFRKQKRRETSPVVVGDEVKISLVSPQEGVIEEILPRKTELRRPSPSGRKEHVVVANVSQVVIVASPREPKVSFGFIDRIWIAAERYEIPTLLCVNKKDLATEEELKEYEEVYSSCGLEVLFTSARTGENIEKLANKLKDQISVFVGQSGVGKSSLLNALQPGLRLRTQEVSRATGKGRHTTTYASLLRLDIGGYVVDTPGMREFGLHRIPREELCYYFPEMEPYLSQCAFSSCLHRHEPGCAVRKAVEEGKIHPKRYKSYLNILASLEEDLEKSF